MKLLLFVSNLALLMSSQLVASVGADNISHSSEGEVLFESHCFHCHNGSVPKAPGRAVFKLMSPDKIYQALNTGLMRDQAKSLQLTERQTIAEFLAGKKLSESLPTRPKLMCEKTSSWFDYADKNIVDRWGVDERNTRFVPKNIARLAPEDVGRLKLKWVFSFPGAIRARSQPTLAGGALFVGSQDGSVYALDADRGCVYWSFKADTEVRVAMAISHWQGAQDREAASAPTLFVGDLAGGIYALNVVTGKLRWKTKADPHPTAIITGSPVFHQHKEGPRLYVPVSTKEDTYAVDPQYSCCTFRGSMVALDAQTGRILWKTYTIADQPSEQYKNAIGVAQLGPSGASVWNSPTIDSQRQRLYFGTGQGHSTPADGNSNAIFALDLDDGSVVWKHQTIAGDAWNPSCGPPPNNINCPKENGPDSDFGASPILLSGPEGDVIVGGQKSGDVYGFDPDRQGALLWRRKLGRGGLSGGVHFGMAAEGTTVFVPLDDMDHYQPYPIDRYSKLLPSKPGVYAVDGLTGAVRWSALIQEHCLQDECGGYSAAITAIPGVVFACSRSGQCSALASGSGKLLWQFNTAQTFTSLNGDTANGGEIDGPGPMVVNGVLYVNSGYGNFVGLPGNVLLAFSVDGE